MRPLLLLPVLLLASCAAKPEPLTVQSVMQRAEAVGVRCPREGACLGETRLSPLVLSKALDLPLEQTGDNWDASTTTLEVHVWPIGGDVYVVHARTH